MPEPLETPGQSQTGAPPAPPPSTPGGSAEKTDITPAQTTPPPAGETAKADEKPLETIATELDDEEKTLQTQHGEHWSLKAYREEKKRAAKYKDVREVVDRIGNPAIVSDGLAIAETFFDPGAEITDVKAALREADQDRYYELRNSHYDEFLQQYPDHMATDLVGEKTTRAELKQALAALRSGSTKRASTTAKPAAALKLSAGLADDYPEDAEAIQALQAELEELRAAKQEPEPAAPKPGEKSAEQQLTELRTEQQRDAYLKETQAEGAKFYDQVHAAVDEGLTALGLAPSKDDPEELKSLKEAAWDYLKSKVDNQYDSHPENVALADRIVEHIARKQYRRVEGYMPTVKTAAQAALEELATTGKGKALVDAVKSHLKSSAAKGAQTKSGGKPFIAGSVPPAAPGWKPTGKTEDEMWDSAQEELRRRRAG